MNRYKLWGFACLPLLLLLMCGMPNRAAVPKRPATQSRDPAHPPSAVDGGDPRTVATDRTDIYLMAYNGCTVDYVYNIGLAISTDGFTFVKSAQNPILRPSTSGWDSLLVKDPNLIKVGNTYYLYYTGFSGRSIQIGMAYSYDGLTWFKYARNPILTFTGNVWHRFPKVTYDPDDPDSTQHFKMWYVDDNGDIGYAYSSDGFSFQRYEGNPVLVKGRAGDWDGVAISSPGAVYKAPDGYWYLFYNGRRNASGGIQADSIGLARFSDPKSHYTKVNNNPIISPRTNATGSLKANATVGSTTISVADTSSFRQNEYILLYDENSTEQLDRIVSVDSPTQLTLREPVVHDYTTDKNGIIRSAYYGSINSSTLSIEGNNYYLYGTGFQPLGDKNTLNEYSVVFSSKSLLDGWSIDYDRGILLPYHEVAPNGTKAWDYSSAENPSVIRAVGQ
jgi:predicted GH43/DUF377 family glycosyl hydrolase